MLPASAEETVTCSQTWLVGTVPADPLREPGPAAARFNAPIPLLNRAILPIVVFNGSLRKQAASEWHLQVRLLGSEQPCLNLPAHVVDGVQDTKLRVFHQATPHILEGCIQCAF